jgi:hypothetical protein
MKPRHYSQGVEKMREGSSFCRRRAATDRRQVILRSAEESVSDIQFERRSNRVGQARALGGPQGDNGVRTAQKAARSPLGRPGCSSSCLSDPAARHKVSRLRPIEAGGGVLRDTRRWSTGFTTPLAYMTIVQQTTSFRNRVLAACQRPARGCRSGRDARRAAFRTTRWPHYRHEPGKSCKRNREGSLRICGSRPV